MLWTAPRQLELYGRFSLLASLQITAEHFLDVVAAASDAYLFSEHLRVDCDVGFDGGHVGAGVAEGGSHFLSFGWGFDPD